MCVRVCVCVCVCVCACVCEYVPVVGVGPPAAEAPCRRHHSMRTGCVKGGEVIKGTCYPCRMSFMLR